MNKKIAISISVISLIVCTVVALSLFTRGDKPLPDVESNVIEATEEEVVDTGNQDVVEPSEEYEQDRTLKFDDYVTTIKGAESYVTNPEDIKTNGNTAVDVVDCYDFSNGFILQNTKNITVASYGFNEGELYGADPDTIIHVKEEDALKTTVQQLRLDSLTTLGLNYYLACEPTGVPMNAETTLGVGLKDWELYFEVAPYKDPTIEDWCQLLCDTVTDTAFGSTLYVEAYLPTSNKYVAYAFILCERDRILSISISDTTRDNLWSYLIELTNDSISLVK